MKSLTERAALASAYTLTGYFTNLTVIKQPNASVIAGTRKGLNLKISEKPMQLNISVPDQVKEYWRITY